MTGINGVLALMIIGSFLIAIILHEVGQALISYWLNLRMANIDGRQSLHIRPHLSTQGTLFCMLIAFQPFFPVGLGWGKPLQSDAWRMQAVGRAGKSMISLAGPFVNFLVGVLLALSMRFLAPFLLGFDTLFAQRLLQILLVFASVNISLALFNLIPLYPLDGYQLVSSFLPAGIARVFTKMARPGLVLIWLLFFVLPFLVQLSGGSLFPLFRLPNYILSGSFLLIATMIGSHTSLELVRGLYFS